MKHASFNVNLYLNGTELSMLLLSMFVNLYRELIEACHIVWDSTYYFHSCQVIYMKHAYLCEVRPTISTVVKSSKWSMPYLCEVRPTISTVVKSSQWIMSYLCETRPTISTVVKSSQWSLSYLYEVRPTIFSFVKSSKWVFIVCHFAYSIAGISLHKSLFFSFETLCYLCMVNLIITHV